MYIPRTFRSLLGSYKTLISEKASSNWRSLGLSKNIPLGLRGAAQPHGGRHRAYFARGSPVLVKVENTSHHSRNNSVYNLFLNAMSQRLYSKAYRAEEGMASVARVYAGMSSIDLVFGCNRLMHAGINMLIVVLWGVLASVCMLMSHA